MAWGVDIHKTYTHLHESDFKSQTQPACAWINKEVWINIVTDWKLAKNKSISYLSQKEKINFYDFHNYYNFCILSLFLTFVAIYEIDLNKYSAFYDIRKVYHGICNLTNDGFIPRINGQIP